MDQLQVVACGYALPPHTLRARLESLGRRCGVSLRGVIVANKPGTVGQGDGTWSVISGSNRAHDFSAYAEGLASLWADGVESGYVLFINDSLFESHHPTANLRALIRQLPLLAQIQAPAITGKVDHYATICHANPWSGLGLYVSTYCFALNRAALPILAGLDDMASVDLGDAVSASSLASQEWGSAMSAPFREFVRSFLVYGHPDFRWQGLGRYASNDHLLAVKARCIYLEHRLSGEIGRSGCIVPINLRRLDRLRLDLSERFARLMRRVGLEPR